MGTTTDSHTSTSAEEALRQPMASRGESCSRRPDSDAFREFMGSGWDPRIAKEVEHCDVADYLPQRVAKAGRPFAGERPVIPAGTYRVRNSDCTHHFRIYSAFAHLSGLGGEREPDSVLVLESKENGSREAVLYFKPCTSRSAQEFYSDPQCGEFWVGTCPPLKEVHQEMGLRCAHIDTLPDALTRDAGRVKLRIMHGANAPIEAVINEIRERAGLPFDKEAKSADEAFEERLSEIRPHRDAFRLAELTRAIEVARAGFEDIVRVLPRAVGHRRGECIIGGAFGTVIHEEGNGLDYDTIVASDGHTSTLHWVDNNGPVSEGDLILVDTDVEINSLYTADITRTLPVNGCFTEVQARIYQAVLDACEAAFARTNEPGTRSRDIHDAVMFVITTRLRERSLLPVSVEESLSPAGQQHRHWTPHGTSHHLGLDVHDCAQVRHGVYQDVLLEPGMTFTIEPGLYFRVDDEVILAEYRGIGVCIEDDVVVNEDGNVTWISEDIPRTIDDVKAQIAKVRGR